MRTYGCSGTLGDTYANLCILYHVAKREPIVCRHYTIHTNWHGLIKQIYSLLPSIRVEFIYERDVTSPRIYSSFTPQRKLGKTLSSPNDWCFFPEFVFPDLSSSLPESYVVLNPQSGRPDQGRILTKEIIDGVVASSRYPVVVLGTGQVSERIKDDNVINLTGKTSLLEAMGIVSRAKNVTAFQGIMSMVAASHRVPSDVYVRGVDVSNLAERIPPEWMPFHKIQEKKL